MTSILRYSCILVIVTGLSAYAQDDRIAYGSNEFAGQYVAVNGVSLYFESYGEGHPLLLVHGNGSSIKDMAAQIEYFSKSYRVIMADSRGHGRSGMGEGALTYEKISDDFVALLNYLEIEKVHIIGWSDGAIIGLHIASRHPSRVSKLVSFAANLYEEEAVFYPWANRMMEEWRSDIEEELKQTPESPELKHQEQLLNLMIKMTPITPADLQKITAPTLVMAGDKDMITNRHTIEIFESLPNAHLAIMPGQTHFMPVTAPEVFNHVAADFLKTPFRRPSTEAGLQ